MAIVNIGLSSLTDVLFFTLLLNTSHPLPSHPLTPPSPSLLPSLLPIHPLFLPSHPPLIFLPLSPPPTSLPSHPLPPPSPLTPTLPFQDVKPHLVATAMTRTAMSLRNVPENTRSAPDPITYARAAVATIGIQHTTHGYFYHALRVGLCCHGSWLQTLLLCLFIVHCRCNVLLSLQYGEAGKLE